MNPRFGLNGQNLSEHLYFLMIFLLLCNRNFSILEFRTVYILCFEGVGWNEICYNEKCVIKY